MALRRGGEQARQAAVGVRPGHDVHLARLQEGVLEALGHAAEDAHDHARALFALEVELLDAAPDALLGVVPHGAGVGEDHVGVRHFLGAFIPFFSEDGEDHLGVGHVHLAAVSLDVQLFHFVPQR